MRIIKTFEAYGEPEADQGKQFKVVKKGKGVMPSTFTIDMITSMWSDLLAATSFDGMPLSAFLKSSKLRDSWENNNIKLTCVQEEDVVKSISNSESQEPENDQFEIQVTGPVSKRVSTFKLNGEDILKTYNGKYSTDDLEEFINNAKRGSEWVSKNIKITKL